jgi:hypothetical protein
MIKILNTVGFLNFAKIFLIAYPTIREKLSLHDVVKNVEMTTKTYEEINRKIKSGKAVVLTAEEVSEMARTASPEEIAEKVDVVTTATFGAMCSSGAMINFGHANPPIRMEKITAQRSSCLRGIGCC